MASIPRLIGPSSNSNSNGTQHQPTCHPNETTEATVLFTIATLGIAANVALIAMVIFKKPMKRYRQTWSQGLVLHQGLVDLVRALLLIPLGISVVLCQRLSRCGIVDTAFLLIVSVSTVNMLTTLINDAPIFPEQEQLGSISAAVAGAQRFRQNDNSWLDVSTQLEMNGGVNSDSPYCIIFGIFIIWFASLTINLGPTFISGGLTSSAEGGHIDVCPMVYRPVRHYVLNVLWVSVNIMCVGLMAIHLRKLYRDIVKSNLEAVRLASLVTTMIPVQTETDERDQQHLHGYIQRLEEEGLARVKMFIVILIAYILFWGPLFTVTILKPGIKNTFVYELSLHIAFVHCVVNPVLFLIMYRNHRVDEGEENQANQSSCCSTCCGSLCCCELQDEDEVNYPPPASIEMPFVGCNTSSTSTCLQYKQPEGQNTFHPRI